MKVFELHVYDDSHEEIGVFLLKEEELDEPEDQEFVKNSKIGDIFNFLDGSGYYVRIK